MVEFFNKYYPVIIGSLGGCTVYAVGQFIIHIIYRKIK